MRTQDKTEHVVTSPCIRNCCLNDQDICLGCLRSLEEICNWSGLDDQQRRNVLKKTAERKVNNKLS